MNFKVGDTVYHPVIGRGKVTHVYTDRNMIQFKPAGGGTARGLSIDLVSFAPWPQPVHTRPVPVGYHLVKIFKGTDALEVCHYNGEGWAYVKVCGTRFSSNLDYTVQSLSFLGDSWDALTNPL